MKFRSLTPAIAVFMCAVSAANAAESETELVKISGCSACHDINAKLVGPSWKDIAARYRNDPNAKTVLMAKVRNGSRGAWTDVTGGIPMPPYSQRVSDADIEKLIDYILGL